MKRHILVIDDETLIRELLTDYFCRHDYQVTSAAAGDEALRLAQALLPDVIILDIALADADGLDLLIELKQTHPSIPIVMLSGMGLDDQLMEESLQKGASGYASKMQPLSELLREVQRALRVQA
jgi:DNA-binding response OmpR family regulator